MFLLNGVVLFTRKVFLTTVIERKKAQKRDGTMTLPIRIERMKFRLLLRDAPLKQYNGKLKECGTKSGMPNVNEGTTRLPRGAMRLWYRTSSAGLKRWKFTKMAVSSASDAKRKKQIDEGFYDPELLEECLLAKCPGQGWRFALGCCRKQHSK